MRVPRKHAVKVEVSKDLFLFSLDDNWAQKRRDDDVISMYHSESAALMGYDIVVTLVQSLCSILICFRLQVKQPLLLAYFSDGIWKW